MKSIHHFLIAAGLLFALPWIVSAQRINTAKESKTPAPVFGPENGGLRMHLTLVPDPGGKFCDMEVVLTNVSAKAVTLRGGWDSDDDKGDLKAYIEAAIGIETIPAIQRWTGQVREKGRTSPQPELRLKAGESLTCSWHTDGRSLKNTVSNLLRVQNPEFPVPGLYGVQAVLAIAADGETVKLRSNEEHFPAGGSRALPKSTLGRVVEVDEKNGTALISLGSLEKTEVGDQFRLRTGYSEYYRLSITRTQPEWSHGVLFPEPLPEEFKNREVPFPGVGMEAVLAQDKMALPAEGPLVSHLKRAVGIDREKAAKVPVVMRVTLVSEGAAADKYGWSKVSVFDTLKIDTAHAFPHEFEIAHLSGEPGVPAGSSTVYLERYSADSDERWKLMGGSGTAGVSHHAKE